MFERTSSGLQNRSVFYGVDFVCFVEGGGGVGETSPDASFWRAILGTMRPELTFRLIARGGKPILENLAREIIARDIKGTIVAMDSDYDDFRGRKIIDPRVLYTFGYSWENDIFSSNNLIAVYGCVCHCDPVPPLIQAYVVDAMETMATKLRRAVHADFFALCAGTSVMPRQSPGRIIGTDKVSGLPIVRTDEVLKLTAQANSDGKRGPVSPHTGPPTDVERYCVGHVFSLIARAIVKSAVSSYNRRRTLTAEHVRDVALLTFSGILHSVPQAQIANFHRDQCTNI